ncbi:MAG: molybdopterin-dependent oxidoreductase, partial [Bacillales bacterium]
MSKNFLKGISEKMMSRRNFLKWSGAVTAPAIIGGTAAGSKIVAKSVNAAKAADKSEEQIITTCSTINCGGRCLVKAHIKDGVVTRVTTDTKEDTFSMPQLRACIRGRGYRKFVYHPDRLKYPMKRKHWEPGGGKKELRGKDEWVRISWEEAIDIVASELKRIKEKYGNKAIVAKHQDKVLNAFGGSLITWGVTSDGAWPQPIEKMSGGLVREVSDRLDWRNTKLLVLFGSNPAWS